jgi:Cyclic nucleotide-binding domain
MSRTPKPRPVKPSTQKPAGAPTFDPAMFLATAAVGRDISKFSKKQVIFAQGDDADAVFYIKKGKVKVAVISDEGKEAIVALLGADEFVGEGCLIGQPKRLATASAMTECETMRVDKIEIQRVIRDEPAFFPNVCRAYSREKCPGRRRPRRSAFQFNRKTASAASAAVGEFWKGGSTRANSRKDQSGNTCRDDRHDPFTREPLYEQVS